MVTVTALTVTAVAVSVPVLMRGAWIGAVVACATILLSPLSFFWAREITGELSSAGFAAPGLALTTLYALNRKRPWLGQELSVLPVGRLLSCPEFTLCRQRC